MDEAARTFLLERGRPGIQSAARAPTPAIRRGRKPSGLDRRHIERPTRTKGVCVGDTTPRAATSPTTNPAGLPPATTRRPNLTLGDESPRG